MPLDRGIRAIDGYLAIASRDKPGWARIARDAARQRRAPGGTARRR
jgi:hypothetical protein